MDEMHIFGGASNSYKASIITINIKYQNQIKILSRHVTLNSVTQLLNLNWVIAFHFSVV